MTVTVGNTGIVRLTGDDLEALRRECFLRDHRKCVVCGTKLRWERGFWDSMHMAHCISRGAGGSDVIDNVRSKCPAHHHSEHNPKAVPAKVEA